MTMKRWLLLAGFGGAAIAVGLLGWDNVRLRQQLRSARERVVVAESAAAADEGSDGSSAGSGGARRAGRGGGNPMALIGSLGKALSGRTPEETGAEAPPADWDSRRASRQQRLRDLLGRKPGETDEEYRARVAPLVSTVLSVPRDRISERRRQFEEAAGVNDEQKGRLDAAFQDASTEVLGLANAAIASGDLTPYVRNSRGVLAFVGSTVSTVDALDLRMRQILTPEQIAVMEEAGFDPLEYLGVTSPWEALNPPPPPGGAGM